MICPAENGFILDKPSVAFLCESDLLGERIVQRRRRDDKKTTVNADTIIRNLASLQIGQPVVHIDHGIGRYQGLQTLEAGGIKTEYVTLEYQGSAKLYVPVASLHFN